MVPLGIDMATPIFYQNSHGYRGSLGRLWWESLGRFGQCDIAERVRVRGGS